MTKVKSYIEKRLRRHNKIGTKVYGTETRPRLVVFKSNKSLYAQLIDDNKGHTLIGIIDLKMKGSTKTEKALNAGKKLANTALEKNINSCVFDRNGFKYIGRVKALAEGAREGGLKF